MSVGVLEVLNGGVVMLVENVEDTKVEVAVSRLEVRPGMEVVAGTVKLEIGREEDEGAGCIKLLVTVEVT